MSLYISPQVIDTLAMDNLWFGFDDNIFIKGLTCELPLNKVVHVKGGRGVGKSAFLRVLAGLEIPKKGSYYLNDIDSTQLSFEEFLEFRMLIGYGFDYGGLIHNMTIKDNLTLPLRYHNVADLWLIEERVEFLLRKFDLWQVRNERPAFIPGSMRKEACVARTFIMEPEMIILDSPTVGMHKHNLKTLKELIAEKRTEGNLKHIFIASDNEEFLEGFVEEEFDLDKYLVPASPPEEEAA
ncbi:MAG: ATP-binding cassette domain-containing protein [Bdellovibrionales bacterium]